MLTTRDISIQYLTEGNKQLFKKLLVELSQCENSILSPNAIDETLNDITNHVNVHGIGLGCLIDNYGKVVGIAGLRFLNAPKLYETFCFILPQHVEEVGYSRIIDGLVNHAFGNLNLDKVCARAQSGVVENELFMLNGFTYLGERMFDDEGSEKIWNYYEIENDSQLLSNNTSTELDTDWDLSY